mmetsp:Transcript_10412/g.22635  ORF Transcript_10412/g.22635 Transcript_10412/m.22635 type:complete len:295 (+) Transcript_10412:2542-3426(+)
MPFLTVIGRQHLQLDQHVFLRPHSFSLASIVIRAYLPVHDGVDIVPLSEENLPLLPQDVELPSNERVVVSIDGRGDEGPSPVDSTAESLHVLYANGRKVTEPVYRIRELGDFVLGHHAFENVPLTYDAGARFLDEFGFASLSFGSGGGGLVGFGFGGCGEFGLHFSADGGIFLRELRGGAVEFDFGFEFVGGRLNRHPRTMERKRKKRILSPIPLKLRSKHRLCQTKRMSQMQVSITVRIRKRRYELVILFSRRVVRRVAFEHLLAFPHGLDFDFGGTEGIAFRGSLWGVPGEG